VKCFQSFLLKFTSLKLKPRTLTVCYFTLPKSCTGTNLFASCLKCEDFSNEIWQGIFLGTGLEAAVGSPFEHHCRLPFGTSVDGFSLQKNSLYCCCRCCLLISGHCGLFSRGQRAGSLYCTNFRQGMKLIKMRDALPVTVPTTSHAVQCL
jgi:hypothetical protein